MGKATISRSGALKETRPAAVPPSYPATYPTSIPPVYPEEKNKFAYLKWLGFVGMYIGYSLIILNRKSFSFAIPSVISEAKIDVPTIGMICSCQNLAYAMSKFVGGVLSDTVESRKFFLVSMLLTGMLTVIFPIFDTPLLLSEVWFLQGLVQGGAWPACSKIMRMWFSRTEFGFWYAVLNTSMNIACCTGPIITQLLLSNIEAGTWQKTLLVYGSFTMVMSVVCYGMITNSPEDALLPAPEGRGRQEQIYVKPVIGPSQSRDGGITYAKRGRGTWRDMTQSPFMWILCSSYLVVFLVRTALLDWGQAYLIKECGKPNYLGSFFVTSMEVGGILGSIVAGWMADTLVSRSTKSGTAGSPRMAVVSLYIVLTIAGLYRFAHEFSAETGTVEICLFGALLGCSLYGPIALFGVMAMEAAPTHLAGTSHAVVGLAANVGAVLAGLPLSTLATYISWSGVFLVLLGLMVGILLLQVFTRKVDYKMVLTRKKVD